MKTVFSAIAVAALFACSCARIVSENDRMNAFERAFGGLAGRLERSISSESHTPKVGYFLRDFDAATPVQLNFSTPLPQHLAGMKHYRILPALFPRKMDFHFDGLATVLKFTVSEDAKSVSYFSKPFASNAYTATSKCTFFGTGTGPTLGTQLCLQNPGVNLLPIKDQLWLTIDTASWGRVDPDTLDKVEGAKVNVSSLVLNAHPACDRASDVCYVQHPCPPNNAGMPISKDVCFSILIPTDGPDMQTEIVSRAVMNSSKLVQHSHSPCVTPNFVVSKLDDFVARNPLNSNNGMLKYAHQGEDSLWYVLDRRTNSSKLIRGNSKFVNNHFWNCYEENDNVVVETVAATENYLDNYFGRNLAKGADWEKILYQSKRCYVSFDNAVVDCGPLLEQNILFDYPTYNPYFKMSSAYKFFYAIAAWSSSSAWFDKAIKVDAKKGVVVAEWSSPGIYMSEFDVVPRTSSTLAEDEDDVVLTSILYNSTDDTSLFGIFDGKNMQPIALSKMESVVPFHAHGIVCPKGEGCFTNP